MEIGVYSFGNVRRTAEGVLGSTAEAIRDLLEAIRLADAVGLDYFGVGEHHTRTMPVSSPSAVIAAAAAVTTQIRLGTAVSVLSTDDPIRLYQQLATAAAVSGGRVDITAGRGSSTDSFPLFGHALGDYDRLYAEKLDLLLAVNADERVSWRGTIRPPLQDALVVPRAEGGLKVWLGTGGNPGSSVRAGMLGLPIAYGILGGSPADWVERVAVYRRAAAQVGHVAEVAVATHGLVGLDGADARERFHRYESAMFAGHGSAGRGRAGLAADTGPDGMVFAGGADEIADRLIALHRLLGHSRHSIQMDLGHLPQREYLEAIEILGTVVAPQVRKELGN